MLIRFIVKNFKSFGPEREFSAIADIKKRTLKHHCYKNDSFDILKMSVIYGANGSGKSNFIEAINILQQFVLGKVDASAVGRWLFKGAQEEIDSIVLGAEFLIEGDVFVFAVEVKNGEIITEELFWSGKGITDDLRIYERKKEAGEYALRFSTELEKDEKSKLLKEFLTPEIGNTKQLIFRNLSMRGFTDQFAVKKAFLWFETKLRVLNPKSKPHAMTFLHSGAEPLIQFAEETLRSIHVGIEKLSSVTEDVESVQFDNSLIKEQIKNHEKSLLPSQAIFLESARGNQAVALKQDDEFHLKRLLSYHKIDGKDVTFELDEESDGTLRLIELMPMLRELINNDNTYIVDEMERSIHPLLIKELIRKFSDTVETRGQLIFSTHEAHLLDQDIFRLDEIWFTEKDQLGRSDLYSLNDFNEHKTIDIQKGYLSGRYGAIPFLANVRDLNWANDAAIAE